MSIRKKSYLLLYIILLLYSCRTNTHQSSLIGVFNDKKLTNWEHLKLYFIERKHRSVNHTLILSGDSTFSLSSCNTTVIGQWKININRDSLFLFCSDNIWRSDSLKKIKPPVPGLGKWVTFQIIENKNLQLKLETSNRVDSTNPTIKSVIWLEKKN
jgi:hypothetical protein